MTEIFTSADFWVLMSFGGFLGLLVYFRAPQRAAALLDQRSAAIAEELEEARRLRDEAAALLEKHQKALAGMEDERRRILHAARKAAERQAKETARRMEETIARREAAAANQIAQAERALRDRILRQTGLLALRAARYAIEARAAESSAFSKSLTAAALDEIKNAPPLNLPSPPA